MIGDVLVMTKSFRNDSSWELYMVALSDTVRPTSFVESYIFKDKLFFEMETGESYEVMLPTYYGTGFMPPLKLDAPYGRGALIIPSISYTTDDQASYTFKIPKKGETLRTTDSFDLAGFLVTVEKIYRNPDNDDEVTLELTWPQGQETLDNFRPDEAFSAAMGNGSMVLTLDTKFSLTGKKKVVFIEPEMTWHEKTTIPLELK